MLNVSSADRDLIDKTNRTRKTYFPGPVLLLRGKDSNLRPPGYASHYSFRCPATVVACLWAGLSLHLSACAAKVPAIKSLHLLQQRWSLARDYHRWRLPRL